MFHCHGGGLVSCPLDDYHFYGAMLAEQLEARVVMADYRLAPEHAFPAAHQDCSRRLPGAPGAAGRPGPRGGERRLVRRPAGTGRPARARDEGLALPACFVSISGWFDVSVADPVEDGGRPRPVPHRGLGPQPGPGVRGGPGGARRPAALARLRRPGRPAAALPAGGAARHGAPGDRGAGAGGSARGVAVTAESWPGMVHGWQGLVSAGVPEAAAAFARARAYLDALGV